MKKIALGLVLFLAPSFAFASVNITNVEVPVVEPGQSVSVSVEANRTIDLFDFLGVTNDWRSTSYRVDSGSFVCVNTPDFTSGTGTSSASFSFTATTTEGTYDLDVRLFALNGCLGQIDSVNDSGNHKVEAAPVVVSSPSSPSKKSGGSGYMSPCYYGACTDEAKVKWGDPEYRSEVIGKWRMAMCRDYGAFCAN